ncbi:DcrB-related protein [Massilia rhizosphaerae]|uniref:DcrB-related protein n=1 Tax=Massilia rhizosphaerae TaxID=2784389 RepID=UPI0018DE5FBD|nr:DcrB-related protein [Massilia rhizosphaerae]
MPDTAQLYHANHATFELPAQLKDKTMHMFTLRDDGPSEFNVVVSHADVQPEENLDQFGDRLAKELTRALPGFQMKAMSGRSVDGAPALELAYRWRNEAGVMHQRQVVTLVQGSKPGTTEAMLVAATCLREFSDAWNATFDALVDSIRLRRPLAPAPDRPAGAPSPALATIFALSEPRKMLYVFADKHEAGSKLSVSDVNQDQWEFYDAEGTRLQANVTRANGGLSLLRPSGTITLERTTPPPGPALTERLHLAQYIQANSPSVPFYSLTEVRAHLDRVAGDRVAGDRVAER